MMFMQIKDLHATITLLCILLLSVTIRKKDVTIPNNQISIIEYYQNPIYRHQIFHEKNWREDPKIDIDTLSTYRDIISNVESNFGENWMNRYSGGVRFEFRPPR